QKLHDRYCDLEMVERAFRTMKTSHLELRPVFVKKKSSTQGHVFVVMLALLLQRELETAIADMDITVEEAIDELKAIRMQEVKLGDTTIQNIPHPT
ncbi:MAG: IS1634 family transposase, partial [Desulfobulbaceae bacterium]|nr:IS1634 family transposase [Desulfobulbaceae bacterium]